MKSIAGAFALSLLTALPAIAETRSTLCQATPSEPSKKRRSVR